jgi:23S rRNA pseudouridine1911/1915/1917 synthase
MTDGAFAFRVFEADRGKRFDRFLQEKDLPLSRSRIKQLIEAGWFLVNDQIAKPGTRLKVGDNTSGTIPKPTPLQVKAENIPLHILGEDHHIIVVNKPPGMVVHPAPGNYSGTLVNALLYHCADLSGINGILRPGIVHRLDKFTSGVMVAAKNDLAHESLARQFKNRAVEKRYVAVVYGHFAEEEGVVDSSLGRHPKNRTMVSIHTRRPRKAETRWRVLEAFEYFTLLELFPKTGRTHQIRVHLSSVGHPILGDPTYCRGKHLEHIQDPGVRGRAEKFGRQALHASDLRFLHPSRGKPVEYHAPLPRDMEEILELLRV